MGYNRVRRTLRDGTVRTYYYDRATGLRLQAPEDTNQPQRRLAIVEGYKREAEEAKNRRHANKMLANAKGRAKARGLEVSITLADIHAMLERQGHRCAVTGLAFDMGKIDGADRRPFTPSLDRLNNQLGYSVGNCRVVCTMVNYAMGQWGEAALYRIAQAMVAKKGG